MAYPIVILGSGRGSNAEALLKAEANKQLGAAKIAAIICDHEDAGILDAGAKVSSARDLHRPKAQRRPAERRSRANLHRTHRIVLSKAYRVGRLHADYQPPIHRSFRGAHD